MRQDRRRRDGDLPPSRRPVDLRHARPDGPAVLAQVPARRRAGQLREPRRRPRRGHALHGVPPLADRDRDAAGHPLRHGQLQAELRRVDAGAGGPAGPLPEPPRERLGRDRGRDGDQHAPAPAGRSDRRGRGAHRQARGERRRPDAPHHGARLPHGRDRRRPGRDPRRLSDGPRSYRRAGARPHRGAARREDGDHRHRAPVRGQEGRRLRRDHEDRRALQGEGPHGDLRRRGLLGQVRDADSDRSQARGDPAGRPQQALQAHLAPDDLRLQRGRARGRRAADALAPRARHALPRLPARDRRPPLEVRASQGGGARPRPGRVPDRARQPRRGDRPDPRLGRHGLGTHGLDGVVRALRGAGTGDPRPPSRAPHRACAEGDRGRVRRPPGADRRAPRHPRRPGPRRRRHPRGAPRVEGDLRPRRRPANGDHRRRGRVRARGHDRGGGHGHRDHAVGLHQAPARSRATGSSAAAGSA